MTKFKDFSDQVTFVSSVIKSGDFSAKAYGFKFKDDEEAKRASDEINKLKKTSRFKSLSKSNQQKEIDNLIKTNYPNAVKSGKSSDAGTSEKSSGVGKGPSLKRPAEGNRYQKKKYDEAYGYEAEHVKAYNEAKKTEYEAETESNKAKKDKIIHDAEVQAHGGKFKYKVDKTLDYLSGANPDHNLNKSIKTWNKGIREVGNTVMDITGFKGESDATRKAKDKLEAAKVSELERAKRKVKSSEAKASEYGSIGGLKEIYYEHKLDKSRNNLENLESDKPVHSKKVQRLANEAKQSEKQDKIDHVKKIVGTASSGYTTVKTALSSKARDNVIRSEGIEGLQKKQAQFLNLIGDNSRTTKIAAGGKGLKWYDLPGKVAAHSLNSKIRSNRRKYAESLIAANAPVIRQPQGMTFQGPNGQLYYYPNYNSQRVVGFNEHQESALRSILDRDFSEESEEKLPWQYEEYTKLNEILNMDFETYDAEVSQSHQDMSETKIKPSVTKTDEAKIDKILDMKFEPETEEVDVSDTKIDYSNLDPSTVTPILDSSFYEVSDEEKNYQEQIAKGFAEKESESYISFLESMSTLSDSSY